MLVSTHNLGSVSEFCDYTVMVKGTVLASGPTETTFTAENLERASGVLRHVALTGGKRRLSPMTSGRLSARAAEAHDELAAGAVWLSICSMRCGCRRWWAASAPFLLPDARLVAIGDALSHSIVPGVAGLCSACLSRSARFSGGLAAGSMLFCSSARG